MNRLAAFSLALLALLTASTARGQVVINEIMYRPGTAFPEATGLEFIEIHNPTTAAIDIGGWAMTSGTAFTFPAGTTIPAGGFKVLASNPAAVQTAYGIGDVLGPWAAGSTLANGGEKITLSKPGVTAGTFDRVDTVTYASEGDWALRVRETTFNGWDWATPANGGNKSLELQSPGISNDNGQNWTPSTAALGATPGAPNSVLNGNLAPIIHSVRHSPPVPRSTDPVTISCELTDESAPQFLTATLFWRDATSASPGVFESQAMLSDGAGRFSTVLGARGNLAIVEFYVSATDGVTTRTWPAATSEGQNANCQYQVTDEALSTSDAYYFLILTGAENAAYNTTANNDGPQNKLDRRFNTTLVVRNCNDTSIRYRSAIRFRGNSSRSYQFKPLRLTFPNDDLLDGEEGFNLNPRASFLQFMGMRTLQLGGVRAPNSAPVKPRRNGIEYTTSGGATPDYGYWAREEDVSGDLVSNHWPDARSGGIYKKVDNGGSQNFYWRAGGTPPSNPDTVFEGWSKQNNSSANDWTDLTAFFQAWQAAAAPHFPGSPANDVAGSNGTRISGVGNWNGTAFSSAEMASLETVSDLDQWARWLAVITILQDLETKVSNGVDDDYAMYFAPDAGGQRRAHLVAHDLDTIFGLGDNQQAPNYTGLFDATEEGQSGYAFRTLLPLLGTASAPGNTAFRQKYFGAIRELYGTVLNADTSSAPNPAYHQFIDSHLTGWVPAATISAIKTFTTQRQSHLLGLIGSGPTQPPVATSSASFVSPDSTLVINEVLASNVAAYLNGATYPDVIELYNSGATAISLAGKSLTDDPDLKSKYVFPAGTTIAAGGFLIIHADSDNTAPGLHAGFALDGGGDGVYLFDTVASGQAPLDSINFGLQAPDFSIGRNAASPDVWTLSMPTIGATNATVTAFATAAGLKINEWAGNRDYLLDDDFIEVFNPGAQPVALGLMSITDDFINHPAAAVLPNLSFLAPGATVEFAAKGSAASPGNAAEVPFSIDADVGFLALIGQNGTIVDRVDVVAQAADTSRGRAPNGATAVATFGLPGNVPTPGSSNVAPPPSVLALINNLRISELLYTPANLEYIELHNIGAATLDLSGVRLAQGVSYTFAPGATLTAGAYLVVCKDRGAFQGQFPGAPLAPGVFTGTLDNAGETVALKPPVPWNVNILNFTYSPNWFSPDTSNGYSLTVIDDALTPAREWSQKTTWSASPALHGTPGANSPPSIISALTVTGVSDAPFSYQIVATKNPTSYAATGLPAGLAVNASTGLISGQTATLGTFNVAVSATNVTGAGTRTVVLTITAPPPPVVISGGTASGTIGAAFTYQIDATNNPSSFDAPGLPPGLSINLNTGLISGSPTQTGTFQITVSASNTYGTGTRVLTLTISLPPPPVITSAGTAGGILTEAFNYQIVATDNPSSYSTTALPAGLALNAGTGLISGTPTATGTFNVTLRATNAGGEGTKQLVITVSSSGPLASFAWSTIASPQRINTAFTTTVTARDAQGRTVTGFSGNITVSGQGPGITAAIILITECGTGGGDYFEIQNVGNATAITNGWFIVPNRGGGQGRGINATNPTWQLPPTIAPGQVIAISENSAAYPSSIDWDGGFVNSARAGWCMLCDNNGTVRDFVPWGYEAAAIAAIQLTNIAAGTNTYSDITVPPEQWSGNGTTSSFFSPIKTRFGASDSHNSGDWNGGNDEANKGLQNASLTVPFIPPPPVIPVAPTTIALVNGVRSGSMTVTQVTTGMVLKASDPAAHVGLSNVFDVIPSAIPAITSAAGIFTCVNQPYSYQILATNSPTSFGATNLPAGLSLAAGTGLITGTPTTSGSVVIGLSATNAAGTGTKNLSLLIMPDADGDGMGDGWEASYGLSSADASDALLDKDGDGQSNRAEWIAGTVPNNPKLKLGITSATSANGNIVIAWSSVAGRRYRVLSSADLESGSWTDVTSAPVVATGTSMSFTHAGGASGGQRFYRVIVQP